METGTLNDTQIKELGNKSSLITNNFSDTQVHQACYELRAGTVYYDITEGRKRVQLSADEDILIKPHHMVVIITLEELKIPNDILGRILTKGAFFSLGLSPVNTYADPGFSGNLGIVLFNSSANYVRIPTGTSIAKIEFSRLNHPVEEAYSGQHGYKTTIWPIREDLLLTESDVKHDPRIGDPFVELSIQHGEFFGRIVKRIFRFERWLLILIGLILSLNLLVLVLVQQTKFEATTSVVFIGIITNLFTMVITYIATNVRGR